MIIKFEWSGRVLTAMVIDRSPKFYRVKVTKDEWSKDKRLRSRSKIGDIIAVADDDRTILERG